MKAKYIIATVALFGLIIGYNIVQCYKEGVERQNREVQAQRSRTIVTKDGRIYTGVTYEIGNRTGTLYIEGGLVERDGWSIR
jgi:xanthosine utilization system XapX-like protein